METKPVRHPDVLDPVINVITVLEEEVIQLNHIPKNEPTHNIGKNRHNPKAPSKNSIYLQP